MGGFSGFQGTIKTGCEVSCICFKCTCEWGQTLLPRPPVSFLFTGGPRAHRPLPVFPASVCLPGSLAAGRKASCKHKAGAGELPWACFEGHTPAGGPGCSHNTQASWNCAPVQALGLTTLDNLQFFFSILGDKLKTNELEASSQLSQVCFKSAHYLEQGLMAHFSLPAFKPLCLSP